MIVVKELNMTLAVAEMDKKESKLMSYICDFSRQLDYLYKLITNISVQNLTQVSGDSFFFHTCLSHWAPVENSGCFPWKKPAATESCYPTYSVCLVF